MYCIWKENNTDRKRWIPWEKTFIRNDLRLYLRVLTSRANCRECPQSMINGADYGFSPPCAKALFPVARFSE